MDAWKSGHTRLGLFWITTPPNISELHYLLDLGNIPRLFVPKFVRITASLNCKLRTDQLPVYTRLYDEELDALQTLQEKHTSPQVLALPRSKTTYVVDTDA